MLGGFSSGHLRQEGAFRVADISSGGVPNGPEVCPLLSEIATLTLDSLRSQQGHLYISYRWN